MEQTNFIQRFNGEDMVKKTQRKQFEADLRKEIEQQCEDVESIRKSSFNKLKEIISRQSYFFDLTTAKKAEKLYKLYLQELKHVDDNLLLNDRILYVEKNISMLKSVKDNVAIILEYIRMVTNTYYPPKTSKDSPGEESSLLFKTGCNAAILGTASSLSQAKFISHLLIQRYPELYKNCIAGEVEFEVCDEDTPDTGDPELLSLIGKPRQVTKNVTERRAIVVLKVGKAAMYIDPSVYNGFPESLNNSQRPASIGDSVLPFALSKEEITKARRDVQEYFVNETGLQGLANRYLNICKIAAAKGEGNDVTSIRLDDWCKLAGAVKLAEHFLIRPKEVNQSARCCTFEISREDPSSTALKIPREREFEVGKLIELFLFACKLEYTLLPGDSGRANDEIQTTLRTQEKFEEVIVNPFYAFKAMRPQTYRAFYYNDENKTAIIGRNGNLLREHLNLAEYHIEEALLGRALFDANIKRNEDLKKRFIEEEKKEKRKIFVDNEKEINEWWDVQTQRHEVEKKLVAKFHTASNRRRG